MTAYYNEFDPYAAAWLRNLVAAGHIAPGDVDERSIVDVRPDDLKRYTQVHLFAGVAGWSLAARLAGWPDDRVLWTGSCPCQPFSAAGKRKGTEDARHLWPEMRRLVDACKPDVVAGEQVASKDGRVWLSGVRANLEALGYGVGAFDLGSAGVGAPHIRQRIWWLADAGHGLEYNGLDVAGATGGGGGEAREQWLRLDARDGGGTRGVADANVDRTGVFARDDGQAPRLQERQRPEQRAALSQRGGEVRGMADAGHESTGRSAEPSEATRGWPLGKSSRHSDASELADTDGGLARHGDLQPGRKHGQQQEDGRAVRMGDDDDARLALGSLEDDGRRALRVEGPSPGPAGPYGAWSRYAVVYCTDGKARRFEPCSFPLAHGVSNRVGRLRAYGNAINPYLAAEVLGAYLDGRG